MEYDPRKKELRSSRILSELDEFVIKFTKILEKYTDYVIVSGYVSIVLGRSRATEDVDLLIPKMQKEKFVELFNFLLNNGYECANTSIPEEAFSMLNDFAIRFYEEKKPIPNIEFKQIKTDLDKYSFENRIRLRLPNYILFLSPLELQIAYKLYLSSEKFDKDIEDARHIYKMFKGNINKEALLLFLRKLNIEEKLRDIE